MPSTPSLGLPYPAPNQAPDVAGDLYSAMIALETNTKVRTTAWTSYNPSFSGSGGLFVGDGSYTFQWRYMLGEVRVRGNLIFGSGATVQGPIYIGTPNSIQNLVYTLGAWQGRRSNAVTFPGLVLLNTSNSVNLVAETTPANGPTSTTQISSSYPFTWASGDRIDVDFTYTPA